MLEHFVFTIWAIKSTHFYFVTLKQKLIFARKPSEFSKKSSNGACSKRRHIYFTPAFSSGAS